MLQPYATAIEQQCDNDTDSQLRLLAIDHKNRLRTKPCTAERCVHVHVYSILSLIMISRNSYQVCGRGAHRSTSLTISRQRYPHVSDGWMPTATPLLHLQTDDLFRLKTRTLLLYSSHARAITDPRPTRGPPQTPSSSRGHYWRHDQLYYRCRLGCRVLQSQDTAANLDPCRWIPAAGSLSACQMLWMQSRATYGVT